MSVKTPEGSGARGRGSRQYRWQLDQLAQGLCSLCGRRPLQHYARYCDRCALAQRQRRRARLGLTPWQPGGPGRPPILVQGGRAVRRAGRG